MDRYLILARFGHFAATAFLVGGAAFGVYGRGALLAAGRLRLWLIICAAATIFSAVLWLDAMAVSMSGEWQAAGDAAIVAKVVFTTDFGRVWLVRAADAVLVLVLLTVWRTMIPARWWIVALCAAVQAAALGGVGHAIMLSGAAGVVLMSTQALHVLAASAWLGGLVPLGFSLTLARSSGEQSTAELSRLLHRFSIMGMLTVATIAASGVIDAVLIMPGFKALLTADYGQTLALKTLLFLLMLWFAADNRLRLVPRLALDGISASVAALATNIVFEVVLGMAVLGVVAILGTLNPHEMPNLFANASGTDGALGEASEVDRTVRIEARDIAFNVKQISVQADETIRFVVVNTGKLRHEFVIASHGEHLEHRGMMQAMPNMDMGSEPNAVTVDPGETKELIWKFGKDMNVEFACDIPGHAEAGMTGAFQVTP